MNRAPLLLSALLATALLAGGAAAQAAPATDAPGRAVAVEGGHSYTDLTVAEYRALAEGTDFLVVNVHVPFEGDLPGTDASIPFNEIAQHIGHVAPAKDARILLYCRSGRMSQTAATELAKLGYTGVHNLEGGFNAWAAAGHPMAGR